MRLKLKPLNIGAATLQGVLCLTMVIWLISRAGEDSPLPLPVPLDHIVIMLILFTLITCIFHVLYALDFANYDNNVTGGNNWMRWVEYSMTASIMLWVIAVSSGVHDDAEQLLIVLLSVFCMGCGALTEFNQYWEKMITLLGWFFIIVAYSMIISAFIDNVNSAPVGVPGFVYVIVIGMCAMYMSFGFIHAYHICAGRTDVDINRKVECAYTIDSMISKTLLVSLLFGGLVTRDR